jgi:hypothetical protein
MVAVAMGTVLPATSHTAVITQPDLLHAFIEPYLKGETPKGKFQYDRRRRQTFGTRPRLPRAAL